MNEEQFVEVLAAQCRRFVEAYDRYWPGQPEGIQGPLGEVVDTAGGVPGGVWLRMPHRDRRRARDQDASRRMLQPAWKCTGCGRVISSDREPPPCARCGDGD